MKDRIKQLGDAINETLSSSDRIAEAIAAIKSEGYDVFLVLEATVGFNKQEAAEEEPAAAAPQTRNAPATPHPVVAPTMGAGRTHSPVSL